MARRARAQLTKALADFVAWERVCRVATTGSSGVPHVVPVCHVLAGGKVYFASGDDARKVKNLQDNPRVTVTVDLYSDHWGTLKGVMIQGRARLIERGSRFRRIRDLLYRKYPQYPREAAISPTDSVVVEVTPTRVFSWGFD
jgi:PPOX class probable F420-dependent enzyme